MNDKAGYSFHKKLGLPLGLAFFVAVLLLPTPEGMTTEGHRAAAVAVLMATWWMLEAAPLAATALLLRGILG